MPTIQPDAQAFTLAVERHRDTLHRHCTRLLGSPADGEDALQEALLRAWRSRRTLATPQPPQAWLRRIATNTCYDMLARRVPVAHAPSIEPAAPQAQRPDAVVAARETVALALRELSPLQQQAFVMRELMSWPAADVAGALATTVPATNSALQRARARLRELGAESLAVGGVVGGP